MSKRDETPATFTIAEHASREDKLELAGWGGCAVIFAGALAFVGFGALSYCSHSPTTVAVATEAPTDAPTNAPDAFSVGSVGTIRQDKGGEVCFDTMESVDTATKAAIAHDDDGWNQLVDQHSLYLHAGNRVRVIDVNWGGYVRLRVEMGDSAGSACWVPADISRDLENVHEQ